MGMISARQLWRRKGLLVPSGAGLPGFSHASHPCIIHIHEDNFALIFSMRDKASRSLIFLKECTVSDGEIRTHGCARLALSLGRVGCFDFEGLLACCPVAMDNGDYYFYYSGWNNLTHSLWLCDTGLAKIHRGSLFFERVSEGPVMSRNKDNPFFAAATAVLRDGMKFRAWYNSGISWSQENGKTYKPKYGIHYAESENGIDWKYYPGLVIPFLDEYEHSFGRPTVVQDDEGVLHMWFSCRGAQSNPEYRLGYARSLDGRNWERNDQLISIIGNSESNLFDSDAQSYPFVFTHQGFKYLLYSGNRYGLTGFGYATLE